MAISAILDALRALVPMNAGQTNAAPEPSRISQIGPDGIALIKRFEGCARLRRDGLVEAYPDPGTGDDPWTIGWGATGRGIGPGTVWTQAECDARLERDLLRYAADVAAALGNASTSQRQFDALVSFHYNTGAIRRATLTRKHIAGDCEGARQEIRAVDSRQRARAQGIGQAPHRRSCALRGLKQVNNPD